ncbi:MAG TPA: hypothetical protein PLD20_34570 [Blastocatellia bacterium]|nr:hypothetical protein [Blastocatellia bacterium]HMY75841.1 hypothetical protein [Blastocatellia bacterium]HMZ23100.1 hypothetical protein [Blastocatellia bacterium]HNG34873.1 hypothetical protein [Blastocatellia bacterium]
MSKEADIGTASLNFATAIGAGAGVVASPRVQFGARRRTPWRLATSTPGLERAVVARRSDSVKRPAPGDV